MTIGDKLGVIAAVLGVAVIVYLGVNRSKTSGSGSAGPGGSRGGDGNTPKQQD